MEFDPEKYQGRWYEIGKYYLVFEEGCTGATADYMVSSENSIRLVNSCLENGMCVRQDWGTGTLTGNPGEFLLDFDRFRGDPSFQALYKVLWTDYENYAFVGDKDEENYFILSRFPKLNPTDLEFIYSKTVNMGFDPRKVIINDDALN